MENLPALLTLKYAPYFIQTGTIKAVKPLYTNEVFGIVWDIDLCLLLEITKKNGSTYDFQLNIRGNFKKDSTGRIIGWGSAFKIQKLFTNLSAVGIINSDGTIDDKCLPKLIGKDIYVLNYVSGLKEDGSIKYQMYDAVAVDRESLIEDFQKSNDKGYPKNFNPRVLMEELSDSPDQLPDDSNSDSKVTDTDDEELFF